MLFGVSWRGESGCASLGHSEFVRRHQRTGRVRTDTATELGTTSGCGRPPRRSKARAVAVSVIMPVPSVRVVCCSTFVTAASPASPPRHRPPPAGRHHRLHRLGDPGLDLPRERLPIEAKFQSVTKWHMPSIRGQQLSRDRDSDIGRHPELCREPPNERHVTDPVNRDTTRDSLPRTIHSRYVVLGEEVVSPLCVGVRRISSNINVIVPRHNYPIVRGYLVHPPEKANILAKKDNTMRTGVPQAPRRRRPHASHPTPA